MIDLGPLCEFTFRFRYEEMRTRFMQKRRSESNGSLPTEEQLFEEFERLVNSHIVAERKPLVSLKI